MTVFRCGLIVNPVAGLGGEAALKGSDGDGVQEAARALGAIPRAPAKATRALESIRTVLGDVRLETGAGTLGEDVARAAGFEPRIVYTARSASTSAEDTKALARTLSESGVDLILFAGGDGTARDVCMAVGTDTLVLGVPAGVKMHSGVFAVTPEDVGSVVRLVAQGSALIAESEVVDLDEDLRREGVLFSTLYGIVRTPQTPRGVQRGKRSFGVTGAGVLSGIAAELHERLDPQGVCLFGPGTTVRGVGAAMGYELSLLGVDVVQSGRVTGYDLDASLLNEIVTGKRVQVVVSPIGGQGIVLGRGNQQIDRRILEQLSPDDLIVVSTTEKLGPLAGGSLLIDAPTPELNCKFSGTKKVIVGYRQEAVFRIR